MSTELDLKIEDTRNLLNKLEEEKKLEQFENLDFSGIKLYYQDRSFDFNNLSKEKKLILVDFFKKYGLPYNSVSRGEANFGWKLNSNNTEVTISFKVFNLDFEKNLYLELFICTGDWCIEEKFEFDKDSFKNIQDFIESNLKEVQVEYTQKACVPAFVLGCISEDDYATWLDHFKSKNQVVVDGKELNM